MKILKIIKYKIVNWNKNKNIKKDKNQLLKTKQISSQIKYKMTSISLMQIKQDESKNINQLINLPRFNKQFIGIGHQLQQKKKQRRKIQQEQKAIANRVIYLQKQQLRAQQNLKKKKQQLNKMLQTISIKNQQKIQKQHVRRIKQLQLQALKQQNYHRRLSHKQAQQNAKFNIQNQKHNTYSRIKSFIKQKQRQKKDFIYDDMKHKKDKWLSLNIDKQKGKQKIDLYYKKKNVQHTLNYMEKIQKQQATKLLKLNTIKHLQVFQNALRAKLQQSVSRISQVQQKILQNSRTLDVRRSTQQNKSNKSMLQNKPTRKLHSNLAQYRIQANNPQDLSPLNISFQRQSVLSEKGGSLSQRQISTNKQNNEQIQQRIEYPNVQQLQKSSFKMIRTVKKRKKNNKDRYKQYQL